MELTKSINNFIKIFNSGYHRRVEEKEQFGRAGKAFIRSLAKILNAESANINYNPSGTIDRGFVSGFLKKNGRAVYIRITDAGSVIQNLEPILYRTARDERDYCGGSNNFAQANMDSILKMIERINQMLSE